MSNSLSFWDAIMLTYEGLMPHLWVMLAITVIMTPLSLFKTTPEDRGAPLWIWMFERAVALFAFSALGFVIAYFLAQGVSAETGSNPMLQLVSANLITLVSAGIAYLEGKDKSTPGMPRTGIVAFLLTCVICYQTLYFQQTVLWGDDKPASESPTK